MATSGLELVLMTADRSQKRVIASLRWPAEVDAEVRTFLRDNLLAERLGDARRAEAALKRGFVPAAERVAFLAERPFYLPEVSETLSSAIHMSHRGAKRAARTQGKIMVAQMARSSKGSAPVW